jgi:hypothetical protein
MFAMPSGLLDTRFSQPEKANGIMAKRDQVWLSHAL